MANITNAVLTGAKMFMSKVVTYPYMVSKFAALADKSKFKYSKFGEETLVREVTPGTSSDYDEAVGFVSGGTTGSVVWKPFKAEYDRQYTAAVPALVEMNSILDGMELGGVELVKAWYQQEGAEIDAVACSTIYSHVPEDNRWLNTTHKVDVTNILDTLLDIDAAQRGVGEDGPVADFVDQETYTAIEKAIIKNFGLASSATLTYTTATNEGDGIEVNVSVKKLNDRTFIIMVPNSRMNSHITMLDGVSGGQEAGGYKPDTETTGYAHINILSVPFASAFVDIRHIVSNMTVPALFQGMAAKANEAINTLQDYLDGSTTILNIGVDQKSDQWKYMNRIKFGAGVFSNRAHTIFSVSDTPKA